MNGHGLSPSQNEPFLPTITSEKDRQEAASRLSDTLRENNPNLHSKLKARGVSEALSEGNNNELQHTALLIGQ